MIWQKVRMVDLEQYLVDIVGWVEFAANSISVLIIAAGIVVASYRVLLTARRPDLMHYNQARLTFSRYLVMGLEFQLAADIVKSAIEPSWADLGILATVAAIRTFLNYFLQREMKEEEAEVEKALEPARG
jgi:uncharacterized membrane protein